MTGTLRINTSGLQKLRDLCKGVEKDVRKQVHIALNKTAKGMQKDIGGRDGPIGSALNCKVGVIKRSMPVTHRLSETALSAVIVFKTGSRIALHHFNPKQQKNGDRNSGVSYKIYRDGTNKVVSKDLFMTKKFGKIVFRRVSPNQYPLQTVSGPSPWALLADPKAVANNKKIMKRVKEFMSERFLKELNRRIEKFAFINHSKSSRRKA